MDNLFSCILCFKAKHMNIFMVKIRDFILGMITSEKNKRMTIFIYIY